MLTLEENWEKEDIKFIAKKFEELIRYCEEKGIKLVHGSDGNEIDFLGETEVEYKGLYGKKKIIIY